ncbi:zinc ribbon domain-containing protein [Halodesulfurarchaeum formicicum]|uniref:zinc ribbon domain-containing protein n=1 Tax=Halodesulfurarchaeum formicicum TaxID=1873524 RepID=UPI000A4E96CC|nr:zinc ribbon domain-containing protein [Halodesulfurarchaeum formicicum]
MQRSWFTRRSLVAAILAMVYPGLGHVYLRAWFRAIAWFGVALIAAAMVLPESAYTAFETNGFSGLVEVSRTLPTEAVLSMLVVRVLNAVDAYLTGLQQATKAAQAESPDANTCPECGKELDPELDFCPWCTTRLEDSENRAER